MAGEQVVSKAVIEVMLDLKSIRESVKAAKASLQTGVRSLWDVLKQPAMAIASMGTIKGAFQSFMNEAQDIDRFSKIVGTSYDDMARWTAMASDFGVTSEQLADALMNLSDKMTEFDSTGNGAFKEIAELPRIDSAKGPLEFKDTETGALLPVLDVLSNISDVVKRMDRQNAIGLLQRLGINDAKLASMILNDTGKSLKQMSKEVNGNALYMEKDAKAAAQLQKGIRELSRMFKMTFIPLFSTIAIAISWLTQHVVFLSAAFGGLALTIGRILKLKLVELFAKWGYALRPLLKMFGLLAILLYFLDDLVVWAKGGKSAYEDFWNSFGDGFKEGVKWVADFIADNKELVLIIITLWPTLIKLIGYFKGLFDMIRAGTAVVKVFGIALNMSIGPYVLALMAIVGVLALIIYYWDDIRQKGIEVLSSIMELANEIGPKIKAAWDEFWAPIGDMVDSVTEKIKSVAGLLGFGGDVKLAAGGETTVHNNMEASQVNNINLYGDTSKEAIGNAVAGVTDNGLSAMVNSENYG